MQGSPASPMRRAGGLCREDFLPEETKGKTLRGGETTACFTLGLDERAELVM